MTIAQQQANLELLNAELRGAIDACEEEKKRQEEEERAARGRSITDQFMGLVGIMFLTTGFIFTEGGRITRRYRDGTGRELTEFGDQSVIGSG